MSEALVAALVEIERHVGRAGWDQPTRLFALVPSADLRAAEPELMQGLPEPMPGALSSIEQDGFHAGRDLADTLAGICWPDAVAGCALAVERSFVPRDVEDDLPDDPGLAAGVVAGHPRRVDLRVVVGVTRDGSRHTLARVRGSADGLLGGPDMVPDLAAALSHTLD